MPGQSGYRGPSGKLLAGAGADVGDVLDVRVGSSTLRGTLVPRYEHADDHHIVLKLKNGYNIGIETGKITNVAKVEKGERPAFRALPPPKRPDLPEISILGTGGTIASRVDYRTGAVHPATTAEELYSLFPELSDVARVRTEIVLSVYSENLEPSHWETIALKVAQEVDRGVRGVLVTMGTDTMGYTAAALSFALRGVPVPVLIVGSQRSSDRPSSDAFLNLIGAATIAVRCDFSGVYVVMHADSSDDRLAVHRGTRVRKNHTSARDAFQSIGVEPVAYWSREGLEVVSKDTPQRTRDKLVPKAKFEPRVALLEFYPSMSQEHLKAVLGTGIKGLVLEGTGLGHVNSKNIPVIEKFVKEGRTVCMTSQTLWGRVDMNVYDTGRDLLRAGVIPLEDMLPETALVKLMWALANTSSPDETKKAMLTDVAGETTKRTIPRGSR